ncbi:RNA-binding region RNP-1 domain-containing protein [Heterostelium album PN500]|uniref:RNA-binding region RNP-1 domain-containing protein n=1 Tax=Heterostelium pallidum (strain ATCC 26659 / Pp 5 / PN500) TaxID=670386 RepID=D3B233_HETP5|nr:RNA-binding region RNP-1 domain-containing protein [Heterostelium album PN500]EFA85357.1 RNA-binding region RNP-1 domain-containing protein [Heterostelium album PN500]|eukprot:XP_020437466.1 RNA-binding region RNP-1 domain-containing protein [Heterostelium album PN500]
MSIKLFVGQIPKSFNEDNLKSMFADYEGSIQEISVIRNKQTNEPQGCAFVTLSSKDDAEKAIQTLHSSKKFPGVSNSLQVKYADSEQEKQSTKLFVGMLPRTYQEDDIKTLFADYGEVEDICLLRGNNNESKGCGFIRFQNRESCLSAISALNGINLPPSPNNLVVKFADTEKDKKKKQKMQQLQGGGNNNNNNMRSNQSSHNQSQQQQQHQMNVPKMNNQPMFMSPYNINPNIPNFNFMPNTPSPSLLGTPPMLGDGIYDLYSQSFDPMGGAGVGMMGMNGMGMNSMGGMMNMGMKPGVAGTAGANRNINNNGMGGFQPSYNNGRGQNNNGGGIMNNMYGGGGAGMSGSPGSASGSSGGRMRGKQQQQSGPAGSNLFVYNIPNYYNDSDMFNLFSPYGHVVSSKVYTDKSTGLSKGFGFVSYDNSIAANSAIANLNGTTMNVNRGRLVSSHLSSSSSQETNHCIKLISILYIYSIVVSQPVNIISSYKDLMLLFLEFKQTKSKERKQIALLLVC